MVKIAYFIFVLAVALLPGTGAAAEAVDSVEFPVFVRIPQMLALEVEPRGLAFSQEEILAGELDSESGTLTIHKGGDAEPALTVLTAGNVAYELTIGAKTENFVAADTGESIPVKHLAWRYNHPAQSASDDNGEWKSLDTEEKTLVSGAAMERRETALDFRLVIDWLYPRGEYEGTIQFTLSSTDR